VCPRTHMVFKTIFPFLETNFETESFSGRVQALLCAVNSMQWGESSDVDLLQTIAFLSLNNHLESERTACAPILIISIAVLWVRLLYHFRAKLTHVIQNRNKKNWVETIEPWEYLSSYHHLQYSSTSTWWKKNVNLRKRKSIFGANLINDQGEL
jgi:hypothetical protein